MKIIKNLKIIKYKNVKRAELNKLQDLNIIIGPNNSGKTNILNFINSLRNFTIGNKNDFKCEKCKKLKSNPDWIQAPHISYSTEDFYLKNQNNNKMEITISFYNDFIEEFLPEAFENHKNNVDILKRHCNSISDNLIMKSKNNTLFAQHYSIFSSNINGTIVEWFSKSILNTSRKRLENCDGRTYVDHFRDKFRGANERAKILKKISELVDLKIIGHTDDGVISDFSMENNGKEIVETPYQIQGSGLKSLFCLIIDIEFNNDADIILIDEPELGLNPHKKQDFLKYLIELSKKKQIFIATQDPTFVNPLLWEMKNVSIYNYSVFEEKFCKVDSQQSIENPNIFAGYMPQTSSLKNIHLYVEGSSDVYIFQIWLLEYLKNKHKKKWLEHFNKIGIYHLNGSNWKHLISTIPKFPYKCIVILDGDKQDEAERICKKYENSNVNISKFKFCKDNTALGNHLKRFKENEKHPIYCLEHECIERYFIDYFNIEIPTIGYDKNKKGMEYAQKMDVPPKINKLFELIIRHYG